MVADATPAVTGHPILPDVSLTNKRSSGVDVTVAAMVAADPPRVATPAAFPAGVVRALEAAAAQVRFTASLGDCVRLPAVAGLRCDLVLLVGVGSAPHTPDVLRRAAGAATRALTGVTGVAHTELVLPSADVESVRASVEGALLGAYTFTRYRSTAKEPLAQISVDTTAARAAGVTRPQLDAAAAAARHTAAALFLARDLVNTSPLELYPEVFANVAREVGAAAGFEVTVLDEAALSAGGYGGLIAVGAGSVRGPRLVVCEYRPRRSRGHIALVGKGITFDSGGLSLKPPAAMPAMKADMAGAAAVLGTLAAVSGLGLGIRVSGYLALAENMPSGAAQRPSDVIRIRGGTTVEVLNTDAEGRLVLADALVAASETKPDAIIDVATLTGAAVAALGPRTSGLLGNHDDLLEQLTVAAAVAGEPTWRMPLTPGLRSGLDSTVADIANIATKRDGGMIVAGLFLREFIGEGTGGPIPWAHLDIAGPAFNDGGADDVTPKGGTGVPAGTLIRLLESWRTPE